MGAQTSSAPTKKSTKSAPLFAKFTFAAANNGSAASLFDDGSDMAEDASPPVDMSSQIQNADESDSGARHPQWLQHDGEADDDMQSQNGEGDGYISADTCGEEENGEAVGHLVGDLEEEAEGADCHGMERQVRENDEHEQQHHRKHAEEDDSKQRAAYAEVQSQETPRNIPDEKSKKGLEPGAVQDQKESKSPGAANAQDTRASPIKRQRHNEDIRVADSSASQQHDADSCDKTAHSPKKRPRQSEDNPLEGTPIRSELPPDEAKPSHVGKENKTSIVPQTPRNNAVRLTPKEQPDNIHCPLPPITPGKTLSRTAVQQQENSREQIQTPNASFGVAKMYANFKARFGELLDLDAKRDQQNRDIRNQIMAGSNRDAKIVERLIQEERQKHVDHQRHVEEMLAKIKATLARGTKRTTFAMPKA